MRVVKTWRRPASAGLFAPYVRRLTLREVCGAMAAGAASLPEFDTDDERLSYVVRLLVLPLAMPIGP
jgi:hypothetical protein